MTLLPIFALFMGQHAMAALSAIVTLANSTAIINQQMPANVVISNTGASAVTLTGLQITATATGCVGCKIPAAFSQINFGPNAPGLSIPALLTTSIPFNAIFFAPSTGITGSGTGTYSIGATVYTSDGSVFGAGTAGVATVNPVPLPASERQ